MPISHVCMGCGLDLARERSAPDPCYGLPLVICPRCGAAAVRNGRASPRRRERRRLRRALLMLAFQLGSTLFMALVIGLMCVGIAAGGITPWHAVSELNDVVRGVGVPGGPSPAVAYGFFVFFSGVAGLWLAAAFDHLSIRGALLRWALLLQVAVFALPIMANAEQLMTADRPLAAAGARLANGWAARASAAGQCALIAMAGVPLGLRLRFARSGAPARLFQRVRTRRRRVGLA